jgi:acyl-CoA synthetase (AMP-forming)/AMP-acid ligase II
VRHRLGSVGRPLPNLEVEIRGPDGAPLGPGAHGEIWVKGEQVSGEYLGRASAVSADGWLATNDGGWLDEAGYLFVEGRLDDVIVRGGENLSPGEIEEVLLSHPAVADVAVIGVPDGRRERRWRRSSSWSSRTACGPSSPSACAPPWSLVASVIP